MSKIIVVKEEHGHAYYDASTDEKKYEAALKILKEHVGYDIIDNDDTHYDQAYKKLIDVSAEVTALEAAGLTSDSISLTTAKKALKTAKDNFSYYKETRAVYNIAKETLDKQDGVKAWAIISKYLKNDYGNPIVSIEILK